MAQYQKDEGVKKTKTEMQSFKYNRCSPTIPLSIYPGGTTTHKAIQMYNLTKEDLDSEEGKTAL